MVDIIKPGTLVFSSAGQRAHYIGPTGMSHVVEPEIARYNHHTEEEYAIFEGICVWPTVYLEHPKPVLDAELAALMDRIAAAREKLSLVHSATYEAEREGKERLARIKKADELQQLDDFIAGKITHIVIDCPIYGVKIETAETALATNEDERYGNTRHKKLKLLTLYGGANGNLAWMLSQYTDGSDNGQKHVVPCLSYEHALAEASKLINGHFENARKGISDRPWMLATPVTAAKALGIEAPADLVEALRTYQLKHALEQVAKAEAAFNTARASVEVLQAQTKEASS